MNEVLKEEKKEDINIFEFTMALFDAFDEAIMLEALMQKNLDS